MAALALIARGVKLAGDLPCGIQILAGANTEAMAVAHAAGLDFIRAEGFAFAQVADEDFIQSAAAELLRYRRMIGAERVQVWADVKKKHSSHAITADAGIGDTAHAVEFMRGDAVIATGGVTGDPPKRTDLVKVKKKTRLPVYLGSGVTAENLQFFFAADGFIVGSGFKQGGHWLRAVDPKRVAKIMTAHARIPWHEVRRRPDRPACWRLTDQSTSEFRESVSDRFMNAGDTQQGIVQFFQRRRFSEHGVDLHVVLVAVRDGRVVPAG